MKCKKCKLEFEFPAYIEEVIMLSQPALGRGVVETKSTGKTVPTCPKCFYPIYDDIEVMEGWVRAPKNLAQDLYFDSLQGSMKNEV